MELIQHIDQTLTVKLTTIKLQWPVCRQGFHIILLTVINHSLIGLLVWNDPHSLQATGCFYHVTKNKFTYW